MVPRFAAFAVCLDSRSAGRRPAGHALSGACSTRLVRALEEAWDGEWYRRAYFDDGTPLGSRENAECRIDSIAQSWSVISGLGDPERARQAMQSVDRWLVDRARATDPAA